MDGILKPDYNAVDLAEVELVDVSDDPRFNHSDIHTVGNIIAMDY